MSPDSDSIVDQALAISASRLDEARAYLAAIEEAKDTQPERLAQARKDARAAKVHELSEHPYNPHHHAVMSYDRNPDTGDITPAGVMSFPDPGENELFGTRLAFDLAAHADDPESVRTIVRESIDMAGDLEPFAMIAARALETMAEHILAVMLEQAETHGSDYGIRVRLVDSARNAWATRPDDAVGDE